jgi:RHS repeat-associated protein
LGSDARFSFAATTQNPSGTDTTYTVTYETLYLLKDHLGSIRAITDSQGNALERHDYYPYGLQTNLGRNYATLGDKYRVRMPAAFTSGNPNISNLAVSSPSIEILPYRMLYNGKELQMVAQTRLIDYGARQYDPTIARWNGIEPLAEKYNKASLYSYCLGNPIDYTDIGGFFIEIPPKAHNLFGTTEYYRFRAADYERRNPGKRAPSYYLDYGLRYMTVFNSKTYQRLSYKGKLWIKQVTTLLQESLDKSITGMDDQDPNHPEFSEIQLKKTAFATHAPAYIKGGLLELPLMDLVYIALTPNIEDLISKEGLTQIYQILTAMYLHYKDHPKTFRRHCDEFYAHKDEIYSAIKEYGKEQLKRYSNLFSKEINDIIQFFTNFAPNADINVIEIK